MSSISAFKHSSSSLPLPCRWLLSFTVSCHFQLLLFSWLEIALNWAVLMLWFFFFPQIHTFCPPFYWFLSCLHAGSSGYVAVISWFAVACTLLHAWRYAQSHTHNHRISDNFRSCSVPLTLQSAGEQEWFITVRIEMSRITASLKIWSLCSLNGGY